MKHITLRTLIREMIEERYNQGQNEELQLHSEGTVSKAEDTKAITDVGELLDDAKLNTLVKNPKMTKKGQKPHVNSPSKG